MTDEIEGKLMIAFFLGYVVSKIVTVLTNVLADYIIKRIRKSNKQNGSCQQHES